MATKAKQMDVTELLHKDHQAVRELFFAFSKSENEDEKGKLVKQILTELFIHTKVEEEIVYGLLEEEGEDAEDLKSEAENEHRVVKFLMAEISKLDAGSDELKAKITVLCELVEHHVKEEEKEMFKMLRDSGADLEDIAEQVTARKLKLKKDGLPEMTAILNMGDKEQESDEPEMKPAKNGAKAKATSVPRKLPAQKPRRKTA